MVLVVGVEIPAAEDVRIQRVGERASKKSAARFDLAGSHGQTPHGDE